MTAMEAIQAERRRQIEQERWTPEHDDKHGDGELLSVAVMYYLAAAHPEWLVYRSDGAPVGWMWDRRWWKPKDRSRNLIRAGALAQAEKDRLLRRNPKAYVGHCDQKIEMIACALDNLH